MNNLLSNQRKSLFPIKHPEIWKLYKLQEVSIWTPEEIDFSMDENDWKKLGSDEIDMIAQIFSYLSSSDGIVNKNPILQLLNDINLPEAKCFLYGQLWRNSIHAEVYQLAIESAVPKSINNIANIISLSENKKSISNKNNWNTNLTFTTNIRYRLLVHALKLKIFDSSSFCIFYYLKQRGLMPGLTFANELITRDKNLELKFVTLLYNSLDFNIENEKVIELTNEAVTLELKYISGLLPSRIIGMNKDLLNKYVKFEADNLLNSFGIAKHYYSENPFPWRDPFYFNKGNNFYENRLRELTKKLYGEVFIALPQSEIDLFTTEKITNACGEFMEALGFELEIEEEPIFGSFFKRLKFVFKKSTSEQELNDIYEKGKNALEAKLLNLPTAEASAKITDSVGNLIVAIKDVDECAFRLGAILLVKVQREGKTLIMAETVSPKLISALEENPNLLKKPNELYNLLLQEKSPDEEFGNEGNTLSA